MEAKVSIIIPAYNAEKTLARCVESLLTQTLREISVIIVDDGSTDQTSQIADAFAAKDPRVAVIHQTNSGCYLARRTGLARVMTDYFGFVDADDWVEPDMYASLLSFTQEYSLDVAECDVWGCGTVGAPDLYLDRQTTFERLIYPRMMAGHGSNTVWSKLYRRYDNEKLMDETFFSTWEDLINNLQFFIPVKRYGHLRRGLYHYEVTAASSTRNFGPKNIQGLKNTIRARTVLAARYSVKEEDPALATWIVSNVRNMYLSAVSAPAESWADRIRNVRALLELPELAVAMHTLASLKQHSRELMFLHVVMSAPIGLTTMVFRALIKIKQGTR